MSEPPADHDHHDPDGGRQRAWLRQLISNWTDYDAPVPKKIGLAARNASFRLRLRPCCGHPGEPGC